MAGAQVAHSLPFGVEPVTVLQVDFCWSAGE
jgi:hypothetical protein